MFLRYFLGQERCAGQQAFGASHRVGKLRQPTYSSRRVPTRSSDCRTPVLHPQAPPDGLIHPVAWQATESLACYNLSRSVSFLGVSEPLAFLKVRFILGGLWRNVGSMRNLVYFRGYRRVWCGRTGKCSFFDGEGGTYYSDSR